MVRGRGACSADGHGAWGPAGRRLLVAVVSLLTRRSSRRAQPGGQRAGSRTYVGCARG
jgi:hypothetical protein